MSVTLQWTARDGATVALEIDAAPTEGYESTAEVTEHAVETGAAVSDHVRPGNDLLTLEGVISDTPVRIPQTQTRGLTRAAQSVELRVGNKTERVQLQQWSAPLGRVRACDELLGELVRAGTLITLTTGLRTAESLVLVRYRVDRTAESGNAIPVTIELKRVRLVSTARAAVPAIPRARVPENRGTQQAAPTGSFLYNSVNDLAGAPTR